jgi:glycogen operon protein
MLATMMLSQGVPMLLGGDELGRTQQGNNNAYCQDNELTWFDWESADEELLAFTKRIIGLRMDHPVFRRRRFFDGEPADGSEELADIGWFHPSGEPMSHDDWIQPLNRAISVFLNGEVLMSTSAQGQPIVDDSFLILMNANAVPIRFMTPAILSKRHWRLELDTADPNFSDRRSKDRPVRGKIEAAAWSVVILKEGRP